MIQTTRSSTCPQKTKRRIALLSLALVAFLGFSLPTAAEAAVYKATAKCQVVQIKPHSVLGYVEGYGEGNSELNARSAALKDDDTRIETGQYKRHCQADVSSRSGRPGGRRF